MISGTPSLPEGGMMVTALDDGAPGRDARSPWAMPRAAWWQILKRVWFETGKDNVSLVSAGVAFFAFLSFVPLIGAAVLIYGIAADPASIAGYMSDLFSLMPADVASIVARQLQDMVATASSTKGWALLFAIITSVYGAMRASSGLIMALNIAYEERETRGFFHLNLVTLVFTIGFIASGVALICVSALLVAMEALLEGQPILLVWIARAAVWLLAGAGMSFMVAVTFRYAPDRARAKWVWITPGSLLMTLGGLLLTTGFSAYVAHFGSYNATYGALGAVVVFLLWLYLLAYLLCVGAELNAELEKQTAIDTTIGPDRSAGSRGARVSDLVAVAP
ncbi:YihY/virulence factor BrkB family protein [Sphingomonas colocasiae]|uniref:YihY/virulence factor BrkB family protein n=2 Tax=Sphingomonas colocasiae TaxID=1848973 RepID=A0ABS7PYN8_9SPHN|nr:YihY/virulence factor BrkB family protein [Sphingomonas colocasiae]MBY8826423.1 YihY/virulence factor BrkB family protein [Sphingomonas colocasiae]